MYRLTIRNLIVINLCSIGMYFVLEYLQVQKYKKRHNKIKDRKIQLVKSNKPILFYT